MAKISFSNAAYMQKLRSLGPKIDSITKEALRAGINPVADEIRRNIDGLKHIHGYQVDDLKNGFGVTPVRVNEKGDMDVKAGFEGYGSKPTKAYPKGIPNPLLARAVEKGVSFRPKQPFIQPAIRKSRKITIASMQRVIDKEFDKAIYHRGGSSEE